MYKREVMRMLKKLSDESPIWIIIYTVLRNL